ncbi:hypothetical protein BU16DRAFT_605656 [Lophium mytilinum]|uniref:Uncharacterized protein n=1 Tax=Lophium mytilinum TaxID=390894 RepID=A0A6A6QZ98_9PEZI|nr:hypothetical protein BU16DRAFT_605656 [Lophium mytilinum]
MPGPSKARSQNAMPRPRRNHRDDQQAPRLGMAHRSSQHANRGPTYTYDDGYGPNGQDDEDPGDNPQEDSQYSDYGDAQYNEPQENAAQGDGYYGDGYYGDGYQGDDFEDDDFPGGDQYTEDSTDLHYKQGGGRQRHEQYSNYQVRDYNEEPRSTSRYYNDTHPRGAQTDRQARRQGPNMIEEQPRARGFDEDEMDDRYASEEAYEEGNSQLQTSQTRGPQSFSPTQPRSHLDPSRSGTRRQSRRESFYLEGIDMSHVQQAPPIIRAGVPTEPQNDRRGSIRGERPGIPHVRQDTSASRLRATRESRAYDQGLLYAEIPGMSDVQQDVPAIRARVPRELHGGSRGSLYGEDPGIPYAQQDQPASRLRAPRESQKDRRGPLFADDPNVSLVIQGRPNSHSSSRHNVNVGYQVPFIANRYPPSESRRSSTLGTALRTSTRNMSQGSINRPVYYMDSSHQTRDLKYARGEEESRRLENVNVSPNEIIDISDSEAGISENEAGISDDDSYEMIRQNPDAPGRVRSGEVLIQNNGNNRMVGARTNLNGNRRTGSEEREEELQFSPRDSRHTLLSPSSQSSAFRQQSLHPSSRALDQNSTAYRHPFPSQFNHPLSLDPPTTRFAMDSRGKVPAKRARPDSPSSSQGSSDIRPRPANTGPETKRVRTDGPSPPHHDPEHMDVDSENGSAKNKVHASPLVNSGGSATSKALREKARALKESGSNNESQRQVAAPLKPSRPPGSSSTPKGAGLNVKLLKVKRDARETLPPPGAKVGEAQAGKPKVTSKPKTVQPPKTHVETSEAQVQKKSPQPTAPVTSVLSDIMAMIGGEDEAPTKQAPSRIPVPPVQVSTSQGFKVPDISVRKDAGGSGLKGFREPEPNASTDSSSKYQNEYRPPSQRSSVSPAQLRNAPPWNPPTGPRNTGKPAWGYLASAPAGDLKADDEKRHTEQPHATGPRNTGKPAWGYLASAPAGGLKADNEKRPAEHHQATEEVEAQRKEATASSELGPSVPTESESAIGIRPFGQDRGPDRPDPLLNRIPKPASQRNSKKGWHTNPLRPSPRPAKANAFTTTTPAPMAIPTSVARGSASATPIASVSKEQNGALVEKKTTPVSMATTTSTARGSASAGPTASVSKEQKGALVGKKATPVSLATTMSTARGPASATRVASVSKDEKDALVGKKTTPAPMAITTSTARAPAAATPIASASREQKSTLVAKKATPIPIAITTSTARAPAAATPIASASKEPMAKDVTPVPMTITTSTSQGSAAATVVASASKEPMAKDVTQAPVVITTSTSQASAAAAPVESASKAETSASVPKSATQPQDTQASPPKKQGRKRKASPETEAERLERDALAKRRKQESAKRYNEKKKAQKLATKPSDDQSAPPITPPSSSPNAPNSNGPAKLVVLQGNKTVDSDPQNAILHNSETEDDSEDSSEDDSQDEESDVEEEPVVVKKSQDVWNHRDPSPLRDSDKEHFEYELKRKTMAHSDVEQDLEWVTVGKKYYNLEDANKAAFEECFVERDGLNFGQHCTESRFAKDAKGMAQNFCACEAGRFRVVVSRRLRTRAEGRRPASKIGWMPKFLYDVICRHDVQKRVLEGDEELWMDVDDLEGVDKEGLTEYMQGKLHTTVQSANNSAMSAIIEYKKPKGARIDAVEAYVAFKEQLKEKVDSLNLVGELLNDTYQVTERHQVKVWVQKREVVGPRNC